MAEHRGEPVLGASEQGQPPGPATVLERECRVFCRYLVGVEPTGYVADCYVAAHRARADLVASTPFDPMILRLAVAAVVPTRVCDAYARAFAPWCLLRRKLSLLVAILESAPELFRRVETVEAVARPVLIARLAGQLAISLAALVAGTVLLLPVQGLSRIRGTRRREDKGPGG